jgi:peptidyl-prolyl cis-trans isomerase A (cyclophilin A)
LTASLEDFVVMKTIHLMYAFGLFAAVAMVQAEDANKTEKPAIASPDFTDPAKLAGKAPETFKAQFDTTKGKFTIDVTRSLSPNGADRFYNLVRSGYFKDLAFFRVIPGFMCQFGIHGDPDVSAKWRAAAIADDPVKGSNTRGTITFATAGPNTRTTQLFINFADNINLDRMGFSPFGKVTEGMNVVDKINGEYGEGAPRGRGPDQGRVQMEGNTYLKKDFPNLDYIKSAIILSVELPAKNDLTTFNQ